MSLRDLARELYRAQRAVARLERLLLFAAFEPHSDSAFPSRRIAPEEAERIAAQIAEAKEEVRQLQRMLDNHKNKGPAPRRF